MLQANPNLGWRDVQNILADSASHTGSAFGGPQDVSEHGLWGFNNASGWNGGGMHSQIDYGYGMVNAYNAVRMAEVWSLFGAAQTSVNEASVSSNLNNLGGLAVPDNNPTGVSFNLTVGTSLQIEHVQFVMNFSHAYVGDLKVTLTSAEGTVIVVALNSGVSTSFNGTWVYGIDSLRGELSAGTWTVNVADLVGSDVGVLNTAQLNVFGTADSADDVYHFTDEYLAMRALEGTRGVIDDASGTDWLNFATVTGNLNLNMTDGLGFSVNGVAWGAIGPFTEIENAVAGDGNDTITGNGSNNVIHGMRGNDTLYGGNGVDSLYGGAGNDLMTYVSGQGYDNYYGGAGADKVVFQSFFGDALQVDLALGTFNAGGPVLDIVDVENLVTGDGNDTIIGSAAANIIVGGAGQDAMSGGNGDDRYYVDNALDTAFEGAGAPAGFDSIFSSITFTSVINVERIFLTGTANIHATGVNGQNDFMYGNSGNNVLNGLTGTDNMNGGLGDDQYYCNTGGDVVNEAAGAGTGLDTIFAQSGYTIAANVERLYLLDGGNYNANGRNGQNDFLAGNTGANIINGFSGNDTIRGGLGNDTLTGGTGLDIFQFLTAPSTALNRDIITDYNVADDTIQLENAVYALLGAPGVLAANLFKNLLAAQDADDRILYDQANGNIYYDNNGLTAGGVVHFAEVTNGLGADGSGFCRGMSSATQQLLTRDGSANCFH